VKLTSLQSEVCEWLRRNPERSIVQETCQYEYPPRLQGPGIHPPFTRATFAALLRKGAIVTGDRYVYYATSTVTDLATGVTQTFDRVVQRYRLADPLHGGHGDTGKDGG
jgi:hypothetical protein